MKGNPKTPSKSRRSTRTPPQSAPANSSRGRYSASRLEQLAVPRPASSWKKPIKSKFQRRSTQPICRPTWDEVALSTNKRLSADQKQLDTYLSSLHERIESKSRRWKTEVSPKIDRMPEVRAHEDTRTRVESAIQKSKQRYFADQEDWIDCYSSSADSDVDGTNCHERQGERSTSESPLRERLDKLSQTVSARDDSILELEGIIKKKDDPIKMLQSELQMLNAAENDGIARERTLELTDAVTKKDAALENTQSEFMHAENSRLSLDSIDREGSCNAYFMKLSSQLDSKLSEIDKMRLDHEAQIEIIHDTSHCSFDSDAMDIGTSPSPTSSKIHQNDKEAVMRAQIEMLLTSLTTIKEEHNILKHEFRTEIDEFNIALEQNCEKIMAYVREELETEYLPAKELQSYNQALQYELQITQLENAELRAEIERMMKARDHSSNVKSTTPQKEVDPVVILSPIPTLENWNQFCMRFRNALAGTKNEEFTGQKKKKLLLDANAIKKADRFFEELTFAKDSTPFRRNKTDCDDEIFVDAIS